VADHISFLPGSVQNIIIRLDERHVADGRWTAEDYANQRAYRALFHELGGNIANDLDLAVPEPGGQTWDVEVWDRTGTVRYVGHRWANLQLAGVLADLAVPDYDGYDIYRNDRDLWTEVDANGGDFHDFDDPFDGPPGPEHEE
jgi:hypothetical protein